MSPSKPNLRLFLNKNFYALLLIPLFFCLSAIPLSAQNLDVPYVPTPQAVVDKMLDMAEVHEGDYVIDLGSGDGRIVISAVKRGAYGHGIDLDPERIAEARKNAKDQGLEDRVLFLKQNIFDTDFSRASVITMYLLSTVNQKLRPHLLENLEPGTRIVSHSFNMGDWKPDQTAEVTPESSDRAHDIYYWVIPAKVDGKWSWSMNGNDVTAAVSQQFQEISVAATGDSGWEISEPKLNGKRISFEMVNGNTIHLYSGRVEGDTISGIVQIYDGDEHSLKQWSASRN